MRSLRSFPTKSFGCSLAEAGLCPDPPGDLVPRASQGLKPLATRPSPPSGAALGLSHLSENMQRLKTAMNIAGIWRAAAESGAPRVSTPGARQSRASYRRLCRRKRSVQTPAPGAFVPRAPFCFFSSGAVWPATGGFPPQREIRYCTLGAPKFVQRWDPIGNLPHRARLDRLHAGRRPRQTLLQRKCALGSHEPDAKLGHRGFVEKLLTARERTIFGRVPRRAVARNLVSGAQGLILSALAQPSADCSFAGTSAKRASGFAMTAFR